MKALIKRDPYELRLKPLSSDANIQVSINNSVPAWQVRICGDQTETADAKNPQKVSNNGVVMVRSYVWPGAYSFYYKNQVY
jgi:hypothetical protein